MGRLIIPQPAHGLSTRHLPKSRGAGNGRLLSCRNKGTTKSIRQTGILVAGKGHYASALPPCSNTSNSCCEQCNRCVPSVSQPSHLRVPGIRMPWVRKEERRLQGLRG